MTVVVCTYNRTDLLRNSLKALMVQSIREQIQIVVVDDGSIQDTASVVADFDVEFVALETNQGLSAARNAGVARARGPLIAFTDDDVIVPPNWCESLAHAWNSASVDTKAIGGTVSVANITSFTQRYLSRNNPLAPVELEVGSAATFLQRLRAYLDNDSSKRPPIRPVNSLVGANMSFMADALLAVGGFDPIIRFGGDEEVVCLALRRKFGDLAVICHTSIEVAHHFDPGARDTLRRSYLYGIGNGRSWARLGGIPGLRPTSGLSVTGLLILAPFSFIAAVTTSLLVPFIIWRRWIKDAIHERNVEMATYPLLALAQESTANVGFIVGWFKERRRLQQQN
jgi:glycosyltransferase involved in cell wall biosynthesis